MLLVGRQAVEADRRAVAVQLEMPLGAVVMRLAERLQLAEAEFVPIAAMRLDVIGDRGEHRLVLEQAERAERLFAQLMLGALAVAAELRPVARTAIDRFVAWHREVLWTTRASSTCHRGTLRHPTPPFPGSQVGMGVAEKNAADYWKPQQLRDLQANTSRYAGLGEKRF